MGNAIYSKTDDNAVLNLDRATSKDVIRLINIAKFPESMSLEDKNELNLFFHPWNVLDGMSCLFSTTVGKNFYSCVPPCSNVSAWRTSMTISQEVIDCSESEIHADLYNPDVDGFKLNLGCGSHILNGWDNFDIGSRANANIGIKSWKWNDKLPYKDGTVRLVLIQHSLLYCNPKNYNLNLKEIYRVLIPGGKILIEE